MNSLPSVYQNFIHLSRYARWQPDKKRRETWSETVDRYFNFFNKYLKKNYDFELAPHIAGLKNKVLSLDVMPSMRALMSAGQALERDNVAGYNCSYVAIDNIRTFDEILYILMNGVGVGFSVERQYIVKLPEIPDEMNHSDTVIKVKDSRIGWATAFKELISLLYSGQIPKWDVSKVRKAGAPLKTFGGRSSGPEPLVQLFQFVCEKFKGAVGRRLNSLEVHDIVCKIACVVVVGGVRRSALISLSNLSDQRMQMAKSGQWWLTNNQRALSNNSVCYTEKPEIGTFMKEWVTLYESKSGERGIFNRVAAVNQVKKYERREPNHDFGCNPCSEILLRPKQFCNLSEVVIREADTYETLKEKVKYATILGTIQSTLTNFRYLSKKWKKNCEEERLLGVSLTGIMDNNITNNTSPYVDASGNIHELTEVLNSLREYAVEVNKEWAEKLGINAATAITCVKPSGTVSQLVDCASGIHARHNNFYIRTVRCSKTDPISKLMIDKGIPYEEDLMNNSSWVFSFPIKSPDTTNITRRDMNAIDQLNIWALYQNNWCEHKPSVTITVKEDEWLQVASFVYDNFNKMSGVSFLPYSDHIYKQAPYQDCSKEKYEQLLGNIPTQIEWTDIANYEQQDNTKINTELACSGDKCELVDLV